MRNSDRPEIRGLPLFRDMAEAHFDSLMQAAYAQVFPAQLDLIAEGDRADFLHVVVEGLVELYAGWREGEATMATVRPVETFILAACIRDAPYLMSARTMEKSRIILIPARDLREAFARDTTFAHAIVNELARSYRTTVRHAKNLKLRTSRERLAAYLLRQSQREGGAPGFGLRFEKRVLASYLGMTAENLSRAFNALQSAGVKVDGHRIIITDPAALIELAGPDELLDGPRAGGASVVPLRRRNTEPTDR